MAYEIERPIAQLMYESDRKNAKEISVQLGVPLATVYRWIKDGKWQQYRAEQVMTKFEAYKNFQDLLSQKFSEIASKPGVAKEDLDLLRGMLKTVGEMGKDIDRRGTILLGVEEFVKFMRSEHQEMLEQFIPFFNEFPTWVRKQYPDK